MTLPLPRLEGNDDKHNVRQSSLDLAGLREVFGGNLWVSRVKKVILIGDSFTIKLESAVEDGRSDSQTNQSHLLCLINIGKVSVNQGCHKACSHPGHT